MQDILFIVMQRFYRHYNPYNKIQIICKFPKYKNIKASTFIYKTFVFSFSSDIFLKI